MYFQAIDGYEYREGETWKADSSFGSLQGPIKAIAESDNSGADLRVFMCKDEAFYGVVGRAWVATLCYYDPTSSNPYLSSYGYNTGVNEKRQNVLATSEVIDQVHTFICS